jgi:hypothetical protein
VTFVSADLFLVQRDLVVLLMELYACNTLGGLMVVVGNVVLLVFVAFIWSSGPSHGTISNTIAISTESDTKSQRGESSSTRRETGIDISSNTSLTLPTISLGVDVDETVDGEVLITQMSKESALFNGPNSSIVC